MPRFPSLGLAPLLLLVACSGGDYETPPDHTTDDGGRHDGAAATLNISADAVDSDLITAPPPSNDLLGFVRLPEGDAVIVFTADALGPDGTTLSTRAVDVDEFLLMAYELTAGQWRKLVDRSGADVRREPWLDLQSADAFGSVTDDSPAYGLSPADVTRVLAGWNARHTYQLRLPTSAEWQYACTGSAGASDRRRWHWGDDESLPTGAAQLTAVAETRGSEIGPRPSASGLANDFGCFDMHGNVWEIVSDDDTSFLLHGGSWADPLAAAAVGNTVPLPETLHYASAGLRLVLDLPDADDDDETDEPDDDETDESDDDDPSDSDDQ